MLLVHDGPELERYAEFTRWAGTLGYLIRVLLDPGGDRGQRYSANEAYVAVLAEAVGVLRQRWSSSRRPVLTGVTGGAGRAARRLGGIRSTFAGLWLASGWFFTPRTDPGEREYAHFEGITAFTAEVAAASAAPDLGALTVVCGTAEENLANNRHAARKAARPRRREDGRRRVRHGPEGATTTCWRYLSDRAADLSAAARDC